MALKQVVFASSNAGKLREVTAYFEPLSIEVLPQDSCLGSAEESGLTFIENALLKARHIAHQVDMPVLADDSGLVVPALNGQPGIYSARYAGPQASSVENMQYLLREMEALAGEDRQAYFYCALVLLQSAQDPAPLIALGQWSGKIRLACQGEGGFGYDPIFQPAGQNGSAAELGLTQKNQISHRAKALQKITDNLGCKHS